jgi:hypothetical protein
MRRRAPAVVASTALLVTLVTLVACSGEESSDPTRPDDSAATTFRIDASRACTTALDVVGGQDLPDPETVYSTVVGKAEGAEPSARQREVWGRALARHVTVARAGVERLRDVSAPDDLAAGWDTFVTSYADATEVQAARADALATGTWAEAIGTLKDTTGATTVDPAPLADLGLADTDCAVVFTPTVVQPEEPARAFVVAAAGACTTVQERRLRERYADDRGSVVAAIEEASAGGPVTVTDGLEGALERTVAEWRATRADLATVDPVTAPVPPLWQDALDLAAEREVVAQRRLNALRGGDDAEVTGAFAPAAYEHPGLELVPLALDRRSCAGLSV